MHAIQSQHETCSQQLALEAWRVELDVHGMPCFAPVKVTIFPKLFQDAVEGLGLDVKLVHS